MRLPSAEAKTIPAARDIAVESAESLSAGDASAGAPAVAIDIRRAWKCTIRISER